MLSKLSAHGFRSLDNFAIDVHPGLNVLVGPNGGGKTNILALFAFISALTHEELSDAISASGGASKVFKKINQTSFEKKIDITVAGELLYDKTMYLSPSYEKRLIEAGFASLVYEWQFTIDGSLGYDEPFYSSQTLRIKVKNKNLFVKDDLPWDFAISCRSSDPQFTVFEEEIYDEYPSLLVAGVTIRDLEEKDSVFIKNIEEEYNTSSPIFYSFSNAHILRRLSRDLRSGSTFNFDPAVCKKPNDSAHAPALSKNGDGLAATIYAIQKSQEGAPRSPHIYSARRRYPQRTYKSLQDYFRLVNNTVTGVRAKNSAMDNRITVYFMVQRSDGVVDFPLELASDGTVKWLAFTVALLTETSGFSIEEPENFLHPDIQRHAIELVRTETQGSESSYVLMTTHSETLLNAARPDELIIVSMENAVTSARRLEDPDLIDREISATGFGLGYYYISGALDD